MASRLAAVLFCHAASSAVHAQDWLTEGRTRLAQGDAAAAARIFADAAKAHPFDPVALSNQAVALAALGEHFSALQLLERASRMAPHRSDIAANLDELRSWMDQQTAVNVSSKAQAGHPLLRKPGVLLPEPPPRWQNQPR